MDQLVVLTASTPATLDPFHMVSIHPDDSIAAHIWDTLIWINDDLELEPRLAESWRLLNNFTWEIKLRQGITFQNGEPFNAQAVRFSLERTRQLGNSVETFASDVALQSVEIIDDYTVHIHTAKSVAVMAYELATVEMLPPGYYAQTGPDDLAQAPVGSGPYRLVSWDPGGRIVLEANADYWQGPPAVHTLVFQAETDLEKRLAKLADGEAHLITDLSPDQAGEANTEHARLVAIESTRRLFVGLRVEEGTPLADKRFRQALNYAVDVQALVTKFHAGYGERYGSWVNPPNADPGLSPWPYAPDKARELLAQLAYPDGFEIIIDTPVGRYTRDQEIAETIAAQLAEVGLKATVRPHEWSVYMRERLLPKETASLFLLSLTSRGNGLEDTQNLARSFPFNPTLWYSEEFEQLVGEAEETFDRTLRLNLLHEAQAIAYDEAPWIWLWRPYLFYGVSRDLDWWQPRADGLVYLYVPPEATAE
jgi:peptide/nickel transport system substrate-binding protein